MNIDRQTLKKTAKKTLGRLENDERPISVVYLAHLRHLLGLFPTEDNFRIGLDTGSGGIQCLTCNRNVPAGTGEPEEDGVDIFGSLSNYQEHLGSPVHVRRKALTSTIANSLASTHAPAAAGGSTASGFKSVSRSPSYSPAGIHSSRRGNETHTSQKRTNYEQAQTPGRSTNSAFTSPNPSSSLPHNLNGHPTTPTSKLHAPFRSPVPTNSNSAHRPPSTSTPLSPARSTAIAGPSNSTNSRSSQQDIDNDFLYALSLQRKLDEEEGRSASNSSSQALQRSTEEPEPMEVDEEYDTVPFEETYKAELDVIIAKYPQDRESYFLLPTNGTTITARCRTCHFSIDMPAAGTFSNLFDFMPGAMREYEAHLNTPHHVRKRNDALLSRQGEIVEPRMHEVEPHHSSIAASAYTTMTPARPSANTSMLSSTPVALGKRKFEQPDLDANPTFPGSFPLPNAYNSDIFTAPHFPGHLNNTDVPHAQMQPFALASSSTSGIRAYNDSQLGRWGEDGAQSHGLTRSSAANYEQRPLRQAEVGGMTQEEQFKEFMKNALDDFENNVTVGDALKKLGLRHQTEYLDGMNVALMAHQVIGVSWMVAQEKDKAKRGGILADAMGLGKTVQMIGTMVKNRPQPQSNMSSSNSKPPWENGLSNVHYVGKGKSREISQVSTGGKRKTTLVLAPATLLQQWYDEVTEKTSANLFRVHIHHGKDKLKEVEELEQFDVIITSYHTLLSDVPKPTKPGNEYELVELERGPLVKMRWLRVVIDEAQNIRNRTTRISTAVTELDAKYRWVLTGTPVTNSLVDIFGPIRFLRFAPHDDWSVFNQQIGKLQKNQGKLAGQRAQALLKPHMLRRTKESTIDGRPLIQLGPKSIEIVELDFDKDEREMYDRLEAKAQQVVSKFYKEKTIMKHYDMILVMILRLRQMCGHPSLVTEQAEDAEDGKEALEGRDLTQEEQRANKIMGSQKLQAVQRKFKDRAVSKLRAEDETTAIELEECPICLEPLQGKHRVLHCGHEFCSTCINEVLTGGEGREAEEEGSQCPMCRSPFDKTKVFNSIIFEPKDEELDLATFGRSDSRPIKRQRRDEVDRMFEKEIQPHEALEPSTKMRKMLDTILRVSQEFPTDKTIVYSQWTSMLDLVERYLTENGVRTSSYDGRMNRAERTQAIAEFKKESGAPVMLVSLKCGGVGLNLTCANRVINLDLAWNSATEAQAYDRVHRIGQLKDVIVHRLVIKNTIEQRLIEIQERKQGMSDAALGEGTAGKLKRMTPREIAHLFGLKV